MRNNPKVFRCFFVNGNVPKVSRCFIVIGIVIILLNTMFAWQRLTNQFSLSASNYNIFIKLKMYQCLKLVKNQYNVQLDQSESPCYKLIIDKDACRNINGSGVYLMIIVTSTPSDFEARSTIRESWGSIIAEDKSVRLVFLLGKPIDEETEDAIKQESRIYHDIIQGDFIDSYKNLTLKSIAMLNWASSLCSSAKYIAKVDSDVYLNVPNLLSMLKRQKFTWSIIGRKRYFPMPDRHIHSKHYVSYSSYKYYYFPTYISGPTYVISGDLLPSLVMVANRYALLPFEDVFVTGFCASAVNASLYMEYGFALGRIPVCDLPKVINAHGYNATEIRQLYKHKRMKQTGCASLSMWKIFDYLQ